ncbi:MAG TPA: ABC transporter permease [Candidatus Angelobacter sp.]|nr:ABC transporter permease [Candidatus Angelobacter sp.]
MYTLRRIFQKRKTEEQLESELRFDLEQRIAAHRRRGLTSEEAQRAANIEFGGVESTKQRCRESRRAHLIETFFQDARFGLRTMRRNPGFSAAAILTLALGIGASIAVFSVVHAVLIKPLPYPEAGRIVFPWRLCPPELNVGYEDFPWGREDFEVMSTQVKTLQNLSAFYSDSFNLTGAGDPRILEGLRASAGFFAAMGVKPQLGRTYSDEEDKPGHEHEVVLGDGLWREQFAASPAILGQTIQLNGAAYTVIGVMPRGFDFPRADELPPGFNFSRETRLWVPLALRSGRRQPDETSDLAAIVGRLGPGATIAQAQAEMNVFAKLRESMFPVNSKGWFNSRVVSLPSQVSGEVRSPLLLILSAVGVVLLLVCSNVAGLLLSRSIARQRELTLRAALGAARGRLLRQLLTESLLLAWFGGVLGLPVAKLLISLAKSFGPSNIPRLQEASIDPWVAGFACVATLATGMLFGLAPALSARRAALMSALKEGGARSAGGSSTPRARRAILTGQMALAVVLVVAAGLLTQTFAHLMAVDPGFSADRVLTFGLSLPPAKYLGESAIVAFYQRMLPQLRAASGVQGAALVETVPMGGSTEGSGIRVPGRVSSSANDKPFANYTIVSPGYFSAVQTPLLRGREFLESDTADSVPVVIINKAMAEQYWPGQDALGKQVGLGSNRFPLMQIVGIVADVKHLSLRETPGPEMYVPYTQKPYPSMQSMSLVVRSLGEADSVAGSIRGAVQSLDPDLPLANVTTLQTLVNDSLAQPRFSMLLLAGFAGLAVGLAAIGIYGVISYSVGQRTQEIGIRMALGARRQTIFAMILNEGLGIAVAGIAIGLVAALGATRLMASFLYGIKPFDPLTFAAVAVLLLMVTFAACYLPGRRATAVEPALALRNE